MTAEIEQIIPSNGSVSPPNPNNVTDAIHFSEQEAVKLDKQDERCSVSPPIIITIRMIMLGKVCRCLQFLFDNHDAHMFRSGISNLNVLFLSKQTHVDCIETFPSLNFIIT